MNNVSMEKTEVPETVNMNDKDFLTSLLILEKNMSTNFNIALNEASNEHLYKELKKMYDSIRALQRKTYELTFSFGWYILEKADESKIATTINKLNQEKNQL